MFPVICFVLSLRAAAGERTMKGIVSLRVVDLAGRAVRFAKSQLRGLILFSQAFDRSPLQQTSSVHSAQLLDDAQHRLQRPPTSSRTTLT